MLSRVIRKGEATLVWAIVLAIAVVVAVCWAFVTAIWDFLMNVKAEVDRLKEKEKD